MNSAYCAYGSGSEDVRPLSFKHINLQYNDAVRLTVVTAHVDNGPTTRRLPLTRFTVRRCCCLIIVAYSSLRRCI